MHTEQRDFNKDSATWDDNPVRKKLAHDLGQAIRAEVGLTHEMDILDYACGTGLVTLEIQPFVRSVTAMDRAEGMLNVLGEKVQSHQLNNVKCVHFDQDAGAFPNDQYDLIVMTMALHHIKDPEPLLQTFYERLKPDGLLCLADLDSENGRFHDDPTGVFHNGFERNTVCEWLVKCGFSKTCQRTAAEVHKPVEGGILSVFSVFLITAQK